MFAELRFSDPSIGIKSPAEARGWASTKLPSLPPEIFNRDSTGKNLQGHCPYSISPWNGGVCITAFGSAATGRLLGLAAALQSNFGQTYPAGEFNFRAGNASLIVKPYLQSYEVHDFVLQNKSAQKKLFLRWKENPDIKTLTALAEVLFRKKIEERCAIAGIELPEDAIFGEFQAKPIRPAYAGEMPKFAVTLSFRSNVLFQGPWHLGSMASKACGRIRRPHANRKQTPIEDQPA